MRPIGVPRGGAVIDRDSYQPDIPDSGSNQWYVDTGSGTTLDPDVGSVSATTNATWESDSSAVGGYRLSHDATDDVTETDSNVGARKSQFTVFGWIRPQDFTLGQNGLFGSGPDPTSSGGGWDLNTEDNDGEIYIVRSGGSLNRNTPFVSAGDWGFVAVLLDGNSTRLITWSNSQELADVSESASGVITADDTLHFGARGGDSRFADADLDFFGVADGALLSKSELTDLWQATQR